MNRRDFVVGAVKLLGAAAWGAATASVLSRCAAKKKPEVTLPDIEPRPEPAVLPEQYRVAVVPEFRLREDRSTFVASHIRQTTPHGVRLVLNPEWETAPYRIEFLIAGKRPE